jgi:hypothetical protein
MKSDFVICDLIFCIAAWMHYLLGSPNVTVGLCVITGMEPEPGIVRLCVSGF